jgi:hypothetical protein
VNDFSQRFLANSSWPKTYLITVDLETVTTSASLERRWFGARGRSWGKVVPDNHVSYKLELSVFPVDSLVERFLEYIGAGLFT